jgi:hypothetical protein
MTNTRPKDEDRRFAHALFTANAGDNGPVLAGGKRNQLEPVADGADDELDEQRRFAADLFASDHPDAGILAGLPDSKTVGRWRHDEPEPEDKGRWFDRRPLVDE